MKKQITVVIPAFNEEFSIKKVLLNLKNELDKLQIDYEIIAVNDGSCDNTKEIAESVSGVKVINHSANKGYGAAIKTGVRKASYDLILLIDADGQHKPEYIKDFLKYIDTHDMVIGKREGYLGPALRQPGKKFLTLIANYLVGQKIPDINSGFRLFKKEEFLNFAHLFPNSFSLSTTSTLAFLKEGLNIKYVPIAINRRDKKTKSAVKTKHGLETLLLIFRIIMMFNPLKIFFPVSAAAGVLTLFFLAYDVINLNISESTIILFITTILIFCFGLLADQISLIRQHLK